MKWGSRGSGSLCRGFWRLVFLRHSNNPVMGEGGAAYKLSVVLLIVLATAYTLVQGFPQLMALQESRVQKPAVKRLMGVNCSDISVLDVRGWRLKDLVTAVSLQGLVNRGAPRLYLVYSDADLRLARYTIETLLGCRSLHWAGLEGLLERYRGLLRGVIVYDPRLPDTVNLALTLAGLEDAIVVHPDNLEWLESLGFKVLRDLRGRYGSKLEVYEEVYKLLPYTNTTSIAILKAGVVNMADYAVEHRMAIIDLSPLPENAAERGLLERILEAHPGRLAFGFFPGGGRGERVGVELLSRYGKTLIVADYASSLSFTEHLHSYIKPGTPTHRAPRAFKPEPGGVYAAIILSDGDNIGFLQHILLTKSWWYNPLRGSFPMGWTVNPWLAGLAPNLLSLLESQATGSDELVAGVAVAGHMDSEVMPAEALGDLALRVAPLVREAGLQALLSWDPLGHRGFEYFKWVYRYFYPTIRWSDYGYPGFSLWEGRPVIYTIYLKRASFKEVVDSVLNNVGSRPLMLAFLVDVWSFHSLSQVAELAEYLESRGVTLVGPLELAEAVREYYGVYYNSTTRPWTRVGEAGIRLTASDCGDGRGPVYVRVYGRDSGELLALLKVDPYIEAVQGGFWASEVECRLVRASSDGFTYYFKGRGVEVVKTYRVKGPLVVVSVTVRGGFQSILDVALDELDTITWPPGGLEYSRGITGPRYVYTPQRGLLERPLGPDPLLICGDCRELVVFDSSYPYTRAVGLYINATSSPVEVIDAFNKNPSTGVGGDKDGDGVGEYHAIALRIPSSQARGGVTYSYLVVPLTHGWTVRVPSGDPAWLAHSILLPGLEELVGNAPHTRTPGTTATHTLTGTPTGAGSNVTKTTTHNPGPGRSPRHYSYLIAVAAAAVLAALLPALAAALRGSRQT